MNERIYYNRSHGALLILNVQFRKRQAEEWAVVIWRLKSQQWWSRESDDSQSTAKLTAVFEVSNKTTLAHMWHSKKANVLKIDATRNKRWSRWCTCPNMPCTCSINAELSQNSFSNSEIARLSAMKSRSFTHFFFLWWQVCEHLGYVLNKNWPGER